MKGNALEYIFIALLAIVFIVVVISIIKNFLRPEVIPKEKRIIDVRYACSKYNNSRINYENFKTVLYGFLTDQCNNFSAVLDQKIRFEDIAKSVKEIDEKREIIKLSYCHFLETNTGSVYTCCRDSFEMGEKINITRREIKYSDILICGER